MKHLWRLRISFFFFLHRWAVVFNLWVSRRITLPFLSEKRKQVPYYANFDKGVYEDWEDDMMNWNVFIR